MEVLQRSSKAAVLNFNNINNEYWCKWSLASFVASDAIGSGALSCLYAETCVARNSWREFITKVLEGSLSLWRCMHSLSGAFKVWSAFQLSNIRATLGKSALSKLLPCTINGDPNGGCYDLQSQFRHDNAFIRQVPRLFEYIMLSRSKMTTSASHADILCCDERHERCNIISESSSVSSANLIRFCSLL